MLSLNIEAHEEYTSSSILIAEFRRLYIKTGIFDVELSKIISVLSDSRNDSDYDDLFIVSKEEVIQHINEAEFFLEKIKEYLSTK